MNKTYITPTIKVMELKTEAILETSPIVVDPTTETDTQYSKESGFFGDSDNFEE